MSESFIVAYAKQLSQHFMTLILFQTQKLARRWRPSFDVESFGTPTRSSSRTRIPSTGTRSVKSWSAETCFSGAASSTCPSSTSAASSPSPSPIPTSASELRSPKKTPEEFTRRKRGMLSKCWRCFSSSGLGFDSRHCRKFIFQLCWDFWQWLEGSE